MANIYIFVSDEGAEYIKETIPEASVTENSFVEIVNEKYGSYFDTRTGLNIYDKETLKTFYTIPHKYVKTIFTL